MLGRWTTDLYRRVVHGLCYLPPLGMGYTGWTPDVVGRLDVDEIRWHLDKLIEQREADIEALRPRRAASSPASSTD